MNIIKTFTNKTNEDLTGKEGYLVKFDTTGISVASAITDKVIGVVTKGGITEADVCIFGECQALCGGAVTAGKFLTPHTDGTIIDSASSCTECALALETGVAGAWSQIVVFPTNNAVA